MDQLNPQQQYPEVNQTLPQETAVAGEEAVSGRSLRTFAAFRHRNYQLFFGGQIVSITGTWLQSVAQGWLVYDLTNSKFLLGLVNTLGSLPVFFLCLFAGVVADRVRKRDLIMVTQACMAALAFSLAMLVKTDVVSYHHVVVIAVMLGVVQAFDIPTRQSFIVEMVGKDDLPNAIALNSVTFNTARILGPTVAGIVITRLGVEAAFFLNSVSFLPVILALGMMKLPPTPVVEHEHGMSQLLDGFHYVRTHKMIRSLLILTACISVFAMPYAVLMPVFARDVLHSGAKGLGYLVSSIGVGALIGAMLLSSLGNFKGKARLLFAGNLTFAVMITLFSFSTSLPLSMALLVGAGWGMMTNMALTNTLIQTCCPDDMRGRVVSTYIFFHMGIGWLGSLQAGSVAQLLGAPMALRIGAIVCAAAGLLLVPGIIRNESRLCDNPAEEPSPIP